MCRFASLLRWQKMHVRAPVMAAIAITARAKPGGELRAARAAPSRLRTVASGEKMTHDAK
jgi:hypothetical protein